MIFHFIASNQLNFNNFDNMEKFVLAYPRFQTLILNSDDELEILFKLMGMDKVNSREIHKTHFSKYWDLSSYKLPEYNKDEFDEFYQKWLKNSGRANTMDEYAGLVFLQELSAKWNKLNHRIVVKEND